MADEAEEAKEEVRKESGFTVLRKQDVELVQRWVDEAAGRHTTNPTVGRRPQEDVFSELGVRTHR